MMRRFIIAHCKEDRRIGVRIVNAVAWLWKHGGLFDLYKRYHDFELNSVSCLETWPLPHTVESIKLVL